MQKFLKEKIKEIRPLFEKGGKFEKLYPVYEAHETIFFQPKETVGKKGAHIRDAVDMKRVMVTVIAALVPCIIFGMWNSGLQHFAVLSPEYLAKEYGEGFVPGFIDYIWFGAIKFIPILAVSYIVGLGIEFTFAVIRSHPVSEGFLVSGLLIPLVVPSTIPLWQVALATAFAVVIGKEVFGGTGYNILNPALTARAFLFFAYPGQISGDSVWVDLDGLSSGHLVDGYSGATVLADAAKGLISADVANYRYSFSDMFFGFIPGSIGETSTFMILIGALILVGTGVGSWRVMAGMVIGALVMALVVENFRSVPFFGASHFYYHLVVGGFAFGTVFMATDPVSAAHTSKGKYIYGFLAGLLSILVRVLNPAYPEGVMLAILLANVFAPLIDFYVVQANKKRRLSRATV